MVRDWGNSADVRLNTYVKTRLKLITFTFALTYKYDYNVKHIQSKKYTRILCRKIIVKMSIKKNVGKEIQMKKWGKYFEIQDKFLITGKQGFHHLLKG